MNVGQMLVETVCGDNPGKLIQKEIIMNVCIQQPENSHPKNNLLNEGKMIKHQLKLF